MSATWATSSNRRSGCCFPTDGHPPPRHVDACRPGCRSEMQCVLLGVVTELRATTHTIEFPYTRTLGPVIGPFLTGLRDATILGARTGDGRVLVPPLEWDRATGA